MDDQRLFQALRQLWAVALEINRHEYSGSNSELNAALDNAEKVLKTDPKWVREWERYREYERREAALYDEHHHIGDYSVEGMKRISQKVDALRNEYAGLWPYLSGHDGS